MTEAVYEYDEDELDSITSEPNSYEHEEVAETHPDPESARESEIAESIRKLRDLERDRSLWEEERKKREARERAEEEERRAKAEQRRKAEEQEQKEREEAARERRRAQEEELQQRRERETRQRRQRQRWDSGIWTTHRALERYKMLCEEFDAAKFSPSQPITFYDIPWPVLKQPSQLTVEDIDWNAVEQFFTNVKEHMRSQDYNVFVEKSHRRFHPDRWRARKVWTAISDEAERGYLEVAANTVAQAITPIWTGLKG